VAATAPSPTRIASVGPLIRMVRVPLSSRTSRSRSTVVSSLQRRLQFGFVHLLVRLDAIGQLAR
jgi:hypothetical protein